MTDPSHGLIIFVKNPVAGRVKTRLAAVIGEEEALQVYLFLQKCTRETALEVQGVSKYLFYSDHIEAGDAWDEAHFEKKIQSGDDLGQRMSRACEDILTRHERVVLIGSDCPQLDAPLIQRAFDALEMKHDLVIGPTNDGGYYLIGMKQMNPALFEKIAWSTPLVLQQTLTAAQRNGLTVYILPVLNDIDDWEDWIRFVRPLK